MSEQAVVYSVRHQRNEIQRQRERLRALVEKANGCPAEIRIELLDAAPQIERAPIAEILPERLSTRQAAHLLGCSPDTVRLRHAEGKLEGEYEGRVLKIRRSSIQDYLRGAR